MNAAKYSVGDLVVLTEQTPDEGYSVCLVKQVWYSMLREWRYDLEIVYSTHYYPEANGSMYHAAPEMRLRPARPNGDEESNISR